LLVYQQADILFLFFYYIVKYTNRKTKIKYRPVGILKNLIDKAKIKYRPVGIFNNIIEKQK
jgi:hypothetical protein